MRARADGEPHSQIFIQRGVVVDELLNGEGLHLLAVDENNHLV